VIGQVVAKYRIAEKIGEGGMGAVYRAEHVVLGSPAAIKILLPQWTRNRQVVDRFFTEARAASSIRHVGIVQVFDSGRLPSGQAYIVMELLQGLGLGELLLDQGVLAPRLALAIGGQILAALDAAHVMGVIHRDLKPDNIQLVRDPSAPSSLRVKLLDFGVAKLLYDEGRAVTRAGQLLGTPSYMSPEQCAGLPVDARSDLYAVGCMLFEMLTGRAPFDQEGSGDIVALHLHQPPPRLRSVNPALPVELEQLIDRMLAKAPAQRTPSAGWALAALERAALDALLPGPPPSAFPLSAIQQSVRAAVPQVANAPGPRTTPLVRAAPSPRSAPPVRAALSPRTTPLVRDAPSPRSTPAVRNVLSPRSTAAAAPEPPPPAEPPSSPFAVDTDTETALFVPIDDASAQASPRAAPAIPPLPRLHDEPRAAPAIPPLPRLHDEPRAAPAPQPRPPAPAPQPRPPAPARRLPLIVLLVALLIAATAVVLIGRSAELPTPPPSPARVTAPTRPRLP
jgi:serine/threonine protein kinase